MLSLSLSLTQAHSHPHALTLHAHSRNSTHTLTITPRSFTCTAKVAPTALIAEDGGYYLDRSPQRKVRFPINLPSSDINLPSIFKQSAPETSLTHSSAYSTVTNSIKYQFPRIAFFRNPPGGGGCDFRISASDNSILLFRLSLLISTYLYLSLLFLSLSTLPSTWRDRFSPRGPSRRTHQSR
jgi:hypothetical protein